MEIMQDIRDIAQDLHAPLESALLKCLVLADATGVQPLFDWATSELEGYDRHGDIPDYRKISPARSLARVTNGVRYETQVVSKFAFPQERWPELEELVVTDPVGSLERMAGTDDFLMWAWPDHLKRELSSNFKAASGYWVLDAWYELSPTTFQGILSSIRSKLLRFAIGVRRQSPVNQDLDSEAITLSATGVAAVFAEVVLKSGTTAIWE